MSKEREALKLALECVEAWDRGCDRDPYWRDIEAAVTAIREALAEQPAQQEPVAEVRLIRTGGNAGLATHIVQIVEGYFPAGTKLYTSPPASKPWVGLTKKEVHDLYDSDYAVFHQRIEAKLKEKNNG